jgi:hypothetical protein
MPEIYIHLETDRDHIIVFKLRLMIIGEYLVNWIQNRIPNLLNAYMTFCIYLRIYLISESHG